MSQVICNICDRPSAFYVKIKGKVTRITDTMLGTQKFKGKVIGYSHKSCWEKQNA